MSEIRNLIINFAKISILAISVLSLQACIATAIGAGVGAVMYGSAKEDDAKAKCNDSYNQYLVVMKNSNQKPLTLAEYCK